MDQVDLNQKELTKAITDIISDTNGITLGDTILLLLDDPKIKQNPKNHHTVQTFHQNLLRYQSGQMDLGPVLHSPAMSGFFEFFTKFPLRYREDHIHLTGSLTAEFLFPRLQKILQGPHAQVLLNKIEKVYGKEARVDSIGDVKKLIKLHDTDRFETYLEILTLAKMILVDRATHEEAAYHMAESLWNNYNVGRIKLKFSFSRSSSDPKDIMPFQEPHYEDVVMGLYDGFKSFQKTHPGFEFVLSPSFRKESYFFDHQNFASKKEHFAALVHAILSLIKKYPDLAEHMTEVDTVGDEKEHYRKEHFEEMRLGFRKLSSQGFRICSHHGETWHTLKQGIQAVDNAMNIWHINTLEHGLSLGINPNLYFHSLFQRIIAKNIMQQGIDSHSEDGKELIGLPWTRHLAIQDKLLKGYPLSEKETQTLIKIKFHHAREVEHYQHDVLNRMINKKVALTALPSSNKKLTNYIKGYQNHPFSWWEKKGVQLGVGTDNYITLTTNYIKEMMILLCSDKELKITKLLMVTTGETRRPYLSSLLWEMKERINAM